ncbi:MAG: response regulator [Planctomycetes bacterium]|nr:response regulator [Planctomycetota bacterium]
MVNLRPILLIESDERHGALTIAAFEEIALANSLVVTRDSGEALEYLRRHGRYSERALEDPAVVLLDIELPGHDGTAVLREIRSDMHLRRLPVVVLTSSREEHDLLACYELGVNAYVVKPARFEDFIEVLKQVGLFWGAINEPPPAASLCPGHPAG